RMWIDGYGRVVDALLFDPDRFTGRKINGGNALEGCGGMTYKTGASGHLDEVACMQWGSNDAMRDLERTVTSRYVRDPMGFIVEQRRLGLDGKPISKNDGVPHTVVERDAQGRIVVERYRDEADAPMAAKSGCYGERTERDATGTTTTVTCLAADDRPMNRHRGTAFDRAEHDRAGCTTRLVHDKADGSPGADVDRVHAERYVVDGHCANLKRDCFDTDDRGTACGQGEPARYVSVYDVFGQVTTAKHYDSHGNASQDAVYAAFELRKTWDGVGNNLSQSCFDVAGKRALCGATGFAGDVSTYDDAGRRTEVRFIDTDGKPGKNLGATARKIRYDNYDHVFETRQVDERGEPFVLLGQNIRRDLYDALHRHFAILLLDVAGKPARYAGCYQGIACPTAPWHAMRILRRADGTPEFNVYFDATGHETQRFDCSTARCFDDSAISISLATSVIERDDVGNATTGTVVKITPETPGTIAYTTGSELTFTPTQPFEHDTKYTVELVKLETRDGVIEPAAGEHWSHEFTTPPFKFLGWAPTDLQVDKHQVTMQLEFSGPVLPNVALAQLAIAINGATLTTGTSLQPSRQMNAVVVRIVDPRIVIGAKLSVAVPAGLPSYNRTAKAPATTASYTLSTDKAVAIKTVAVVEGANGFYLEVVCDDGAAPDGERSYYDDESYYGLSQRCLLTDDAIAKIHFTPAVKKTYVTPGRAGFRIFGDFKRGAYSLKIDSGAKSVDGGVVLAQYARSFTVAARKPQLSFAASGRYLPRSAWGNLGIKHLNMDGVNLVIRQVPPENLVFWLGNQGSDSADERTSNVILRKTIPLRGSPDDPAVSWLDVGSLLPATTRGVLELKVVGVGGQATSRLLLTDLSLVAKKTSTPGKPWDQQVQVWALGMEDAQLQDGVEVTMVRKSGKVVGRCSTSGADGCKIAAAITGDPDEAEPFALIARRGDDLTYIRYQDLRADLADSSTAGVPYASANPYRAAMFSDRGVYRPGDTAHVTAIVRDAKDRAPDGELPVDVLVLDPRAKTVRKQTMKTNAAGVIVVDQAFPAFADTGHWRVQLEVADKVIAAYDVQVEEFVPERMAVTVAAKRASALMTDKVELDVGAVYLFGGNAMDSGVELTCKVEPTRFAPTENADLIYGVEPKGKEVNLGTEKGQLDLKGQLAIACPAIDDTTAFTGTLALTATTAVLEAGSGRASVKTAEVTLHPEKFYIGVRTKAAKATTATAFTVEGMIVDWEGKPAPNAVKELDVALAHLEYDYGYGYDEYSGESSYDRNMRHVPEGKLKVAVVGGKFAFDVTPGEAGAAFVVELGAGKARTELTLEGDYSYGYYGYDSGSVDTTPRPAKPTKLAITVGDKSAKGATDLEVGKPVTLKVRSPYKGRALWTVETDHVVKAEWVDIAAGEATWSFTLDRYAPNVYVSAFVVKDPHLESKDAFMPDRAFGVVSARVKPVEFTQALTLDAPREVRSNAPLAVTLTTDKPTGPTFAVVAVVDEGILSLTNFQTPDPLAQLFAKRALGVETYETIGWTMLHQPAGASSKTGGGDDASEEGEGGALGAGRVQPVKPVALWSGIVKVGDDGKVTVPFQLPTYRGAVRVMAITVGPTRIGRAEAKVIVKDPLVIQTTFPRFVTQNDELQIPVFLTNMSGGPLEIELTMTSEALAIPGLAPSKTRASPLTFAGKNTTTLQLDDGRNETVVIQARANLPVGGAKITVVAKAKGKVTFEVKDELEVPFLPAGPKERVIQKIKVTAGTLDLAAQSALKNWAPTSEKTTFWLTSNPYGESFDHLGYLVHYPYGCIEQTTSSARPLLYVASVVEQVDPALAELKIEDMVLAGINRIFSMETPSGGFGYWPGATEPLEWATAYATHFLLDAKKAGYAVGDDRLAGVMTWIEHRAAAYERGQKIQRQPWNHYDEQSEAYLHYVLALGGK
ncbi:MAG: MG2 domain-containing protein, partial [Proteobacteria bacterium]|nr:MG2 domain-containing protein [Pseudomonadota bacterium]